MYTFYKERMKVFYFIKLNYKKREKQAYESRATGVRAQINKLILNKRSCNQIEPLSIVVN